MLDINDISEMVPIYVIGCLVVFQW